MNFLLKLCCFEKLKKKKEISVKRTNFFFCMDLTELLTSLWIFLLRCCFLTQECRHVNLTFHGFQIIQQRRFFLSFRFWFVVGAIFFFVLFFFSWFFFLVSFFLFAFFRVFWLIFFPLFFLFAWRRRSLGIIF